MIRHLSFWTGAEKQLVGYAHPEFVQSPREFQAMPDLEINAFEEFHLGDDIVLRFRRRSESNKWKMSIEAPQEICIRRVRIPLNECELEPLVTDLLAPRTL